MRRCNRTLITTACVTLAAAACWPVLDLTVASPPAVQCRPPATRTTPSATQQTMKKSEVFAELSRSRIKSILAQRIPEIEINQMPLREVLADLKELTGINMYLDPEEVGDIIDPDVPIDVHVAADSMTIKTLLEDFILGPNELVIVIRDNFLKVMSYDKSLTIYEVVVYDCRELLAAMPDQPAAGNSGHSLGDGGTDASCPPSATGYVASASIYSRLKPREQQLIETIYLAVRSEDAPWDDGIAVMTTDENVGTITLIDGLLVVRQTQAMHEQVERLLNSLRKTMRERD